MSPEAETSALYPIRTVSHLTGVHSVTLRAWERRYRLIEPQRTAKGHRLYTQQDIDLINEVVGLLSTGISIGQVKQRLHRERPADSDAAAPSEPAVDTWASYRRQMLGAITRFDESQLDGAYNEALSLYPVDVVTERLLVPLLRELGERWERTEGGIAEEHFFGTYLRNKLGARLHHQSARGVHRRLLAACLPGEHHEIGLLLFCLAAASHGFGFVILGADMPLQELTHALRRSGCEAVLLSGSVRPAPGVLERDLPALVQAAGVPVLIGGRTAVEHQSAIVRAGAIALGTDTPAALRRLGALLAAEARPEPRA